MVDEQKREVAQASAEPWEYIFFRGFAAAAGFEVEMFDRSHLGEQACPAVWDLHVGEIIDLARATGSLRLGVTPHTTSRPFCKTAYVVYPVLPPKPQEPPKRGKKRKA